MASRDIIINDVNYGGWPSIFYVFGSMGILWFPLWAVFAYDTPLLHPTITKDEIILISQGNSDSDDDDGASDDDDDADDEDDEDDDAEDGDHNDV